MEDDLMNKSELVTKLDGKAEVSKKDAAKVLDTFKEVVAE